MRRIVYLGVILLMVVACTNTNQDNSQEVSEPSGVANLVYLNQQIAADTTNPEHFHNRAKYYFHEGEVNKALGDINKAIQLDNHAAAYFVTLSDIYLIMGEGKNCRDALNKALELEENNKEAMLKMAKLHVLAGDLEPAFTYLNSLLEMENYYPEAYYLRGIAFVKMNDTANAIRNFQLAADQDQEYIDAYLKLGSLYASKGDPLAIDYYSNVLRIDSNDIAALYGIAMFQQESERFEDALQTYANIEEVRPGFKFAPYNIGYINLVYLEDYDRAISAFSKAIELDPEYIEAYYNRGYASELNGKLLDARRDYQKCLRLLPNYPLAVEGMNRLDQ